MRMTRWEDNQKAFVVDSDQIQYNKRGYAGEAIQKLALFENFQEDLINRQAEISMKLQTLRSEGKTHTATFKQLLATKLTNSQILISMGNYGLTE